MQACGQSCRECKMWSMARVGSRHFAAPHCGFSHPPRPHTPDASTIHPGPHTYLPAICKTWMCAPSQPGLILRMLTSPWVYASVCMVLLFKLPLNVLVSKGRNYISIHCRERLTHSWYIVNSYFPTLLLFSLHQEPLIRSLFPFSSIKALNEALLLN